VRGTASYNFGWQTSSAFRGFNITYPNDGQPFGGMVIITGYVVGVVGMAEWGPYLASRGIATFLIDPPTAGDQPLERGLALLAALNSLRAEATRPGSPLNGKLDVDKLAIGGWSMGGGGTLLAANQNPAGVKAAVAFAPETRVMEFVLIAIAILVVALVAAVGLLVGKGRRTTRLGDDAVSGTTLTRPRPPESQAPPAPSASGATVAEPPTPEVELPPAEPEPGLVFETPPPSAGRLVRLRSRLARSQSSLGRGLLTVLAREKLTEDDWEELEETLLAADVGITATTQIVQRLRTQSMVLATASGADLRELLVRELVAVLGPDMDRSLGTDRHDGLPGVVLVVGVNGAGKTTTVGKIARVLVGDGKSVVLGAADTFRAAAADQLETWGERVGVLTVRGREGGDPASVAFESVRTGVEGEVDAVLVDTAGRLHTKSGLMDELGKVKRVVEKQAPVTEVLLVLDATTGQNGVVQARVFTEAVHVTGVVLTKLDGTAKGGIVVSVQRELGIPVKLIGLGEGPDDLAPFEPKAFAEALVGAPD
jgi:fused signal recognition particle receptor